jgi:hypothetical protein
VSRALVSLLVSLLVLGCSEEEATEAGVGGSREGCGAPGSHSVPVSEHSCVCEADYEWCDESLDSFECCPLGGETGGEELPAPDEPCNEDLAEQLLCQLDPEGDPNDPDPGTAVVWACNGERWVEVPNYATFACLAAGLEFAYGCLPGPEFLCGFGPGSPCEVEGYPGVCVDEDIIDTCVWGRRSVDRCSRLCAELGAFGTGFTGGSCEPGPNMGPATCVCQ